MSRLQSLIRKASDSKFNRWLLNRALAIAVPFNAPHHFKILQAGAGEVKILLPYRRSNLNHVKGIHACALATLCEYTIGMSLLNRISESEFRIILKNLNLEYHYQARMDVVAVYEITDEFLKEKITGPLEYSDAVFHVFEIKIFDVSGNHVCTGQVNWQIKKWDKVKKQE